MKSVKIAEFRNNLKLHLQYVARGGQIRIYDRNEPMADLVPVKTLMLTAEDSGVTFLKRAQSKNSIRTGSGKLPDKFFSTGPVQLGNSDSSGILNQLLKDRKSGK